MKTLPSQCSLILNCKSKCLIPNFYTVFGYCRSVFELICGSTCEKIIKSDAGCPIQYGTKKEKAHCYQIEFRILSASSLAGIYLCWKCSALPKLDVSCLLQVFHSICFLNCSGNQNSLQYIICVSS